MRQAAVHHYAAGSLWATGILYWKLQRKINNQTMNDESLFHVHDLLSPELAPFTRTCTS